MPLTTAPVTVDSACSTASQPHIRKVGEPHGSGLSSVRCVVEHDCAWLLANKRLDRRHDRQGRIILALLQAACIFIIANRISPF